MDVIIEQVILHTYRPRCCTIELQLKSDLAKKRLVWPTQLIVVKVLSTIHIEFHLISAIFYLKKILEYFGCIQKIQKTLLSNFRGL